ncbi:MAG: HPF/RaiA family ribosome-associated protein [Muribaculaceae bacterium]|nr:HPF/RaiA family ribosome-associated protein [Muribaculaceae bacterium]
MELKIKAIHFDIAEKLEAFINKKAEKLVHRCPAIDLIEVTLKVVKPETAMNKEATLVVSIPNQDKFVAAKTADSFEEAVDLSLEAVERQLEKLKNKK